MCRQSLKVQTYSLDQTVKCLEVISVYMKVEGFKYGSKITAWFENTD